MNFTDAILWYAENKLRVIKLMKVDTIMKRGDWIVY